MTESTTPKKSPAPSRIAQPTRAPAATERPMPSTPTAGRQTAPSHEEMHPSKCHASMAPEPSSALRLGFTDIKPRTSGTSLGDGQDTPSRPRTARQVPSTEFTFRFARGAPDMPLSENAQRLMKELREQANIIKADMQAQRALDGGADGADGAASRKTAQPKGKMGRFSEVHMAEFRKMDSIENHASAWRANRTTPGTPPAATASPGKTGTPTLKRSPSKNTLDGAAGTTSPAKPKPSLKRTQSKANLDGTPQSSRTLKRTSSHAKLDDGDSAQPDVDSVGFSISGRPRTTARDAPSTSFTKRVKKFRDDDASRTRPVSRDGKADSAIPRPKSSSNSLHSNFASSVARPTSSTLARLTSPTKASAGHSSGQQAAMTSTPSKTPSKPTISVVKSASRSDMRGAAAASAAPAPPSPSPSKAAQLGRRIISPNRFQRAKSILRGENWKSEQARTALPMPADAAGAGSRTPNPPRTLGVDDKELPPLPLTTPRRRLVKRVAFTPDTKSAAETQNSPSPQKLSNHRAEPVQYPALDTVLAESAAAKKDESDTLYPDLSGLKHMTAFLGDKKPGVRNVSAPSAPGTFTFRSDHTIDFGKASASGFGASPGQASVRQVRQSTGGAPASSRMDVDDMPGSFPSEHPDKENAAPTASPKIFSLTKSVPHGVANKKRHRATSDDEGETRASVDDDGRAAKKRKNVHMASSVTEHSATTPKKLFSRSVSATPVRRSPIKGSAPPSAGRTPGRALNASTSAAGTPSKKVGISMSRLNMLSRPKNRT